MGFNPFRVISGAARATKSGLAKLQNTPDAELIRTRESLAVALKRRTATTLRSGVTETPTRSFVRSGPVTPPPPSSIDPLAGGGGPEDVFQPLTDPVRGGSMPIVNRTGVTGVTIGSGGISVEGDIFGVPVSAQLPFGGSEPPSSDSVVPGATNFSPLDCPDGTFRIPGTNQCADLIPGGATQGGGLIVSGGEAVKGRFGAGVAPSEKTVSRARCPRGMVLAVDGLCYDKRSLRNDQRMWPASRKPLLTAGDLNAISRASRAAGRMKTQQKRLQKLGLLKKSVRKEKVYVCRHCGQPRDQCTC